MLKGIVAIRVGKTRFSNDESLVRELFPQGGAVGNAEIPTPPVGNAEIPTPP